MDPGSNVKEEVKAQLAELVKLKQEAEAIVKRGEMAKAKLEEEMKALSADIKDVYAQCKSQGFDTKIIRKIVALRKRDRQEREEEQQILDLYLAAIGEA